MDCETCKWWQDISEGDPDGPVGRCRRNAPVAEVGEEDSDVAYWDAQWPFTDKSDWCGEFTEK